MITVSVPGKIHLMGEHAVVYGKPALLSAISLRLKLSLFPKKDNENKSTDPLILSLKNAIEEKIKQKFNLKKIPEYDFKFLSEIPMGSGLGSSACLSVALTSALLDFLKIPANKDLIFEISYEGEKLFHGNPSGGDTSTVLHGGFLWFRKENDFIKTLTPLLFPIHKNIKQFLLINSGKPVESTKEMVKLVSKINKKKRDKIFDAQEQLTKEMAVALKIGDEKNLIRIIKAGQNNLKKLGVAGKKADGMIKKIESGGGAAKICGGGGIKDGSGMLLVYHQTPAELLKLCKEQNWKTLTIKTGQEGLRKENV